MSYNDSSQYKDPFQNQDMIPSPSDRLIQMLDQVENRVEVMRAQASAIERERKDLLYALSSVKSNKALDSLSEGEKEEIEITTQRLVDRILSVDITIHTPRNPVQQRAISRVNKLFEDVLSTMPIDPVQTMEIVEQYINSCRSDSGGLINPKFQEAILECSLDDQKLILKKLEHLKKVHGK